MTSHSEPAVRHVASDSPEFIVLASRLDAELEERYPGLAEDAPAAAKDLDAVVAYIGEAPVGCGALCELESGIGEVTRMFVVPEARRRGVARLVLAALEARACASGCSAVRLGTGVRQPEALALYESRGYRRIPLFGEYQGADLCVCYEKTLE